MTVADDLRDQARKLGFVEEPCSSCAGTRDPSCPNCEGQGRVWRDGIMTLARSGLERLIAKPRRDDDER